METIFFGNLKPADTFKIKKEEKCSPELMKIQSIPFILYNEPFQVTPESREINAVGVHSGEFYSFRQDIAVLKIEKSR